MTSKEIREQVSPMVIWMADAAIRHARRAIKYRTGSEDVKCHLYNLLYNLPEVEMAGEVLFRMFNACSASIKEALLAMPEQMDGITTYPNLNYFDEFVAALDRASLRESSWILSEL